MPLVSLRRLVSGGQTGADRGALDAALALGVPVGGWCPRGRRAEDGPLPARYPLRETPSAAYAQRTAWNVRDSDATLVLAFRPPTGGTALTLREAAARGRPHLNVTPAPAEVAAVRAWIEREGVRVLNVAGPREAEAPGIYAAVRRFVEALLAGA